MLFDKTVFQSNAI